MDALSRSLNPLYDVITATERANSHFISTVEVKASNNGTIFLVPRNVAHKVMQYTWNCHHIADDRFSISTSKSFNRIRYSISLWHFLMGRLPEDRVVDHIDRNRLNNGWANLRFASYSVNTANIPIKGKVPFYGVGKLGGKYGTFIKSKRYGSFENVLHAAWFYNLLVEEQQLEFPLNDILEPKDFVRPDSIQIKSRKKKASLRNSFTIQDDVAVISIGERTTKVDSYLIDEVIKQRWRSKKPYFQTTLQDDVIPLHRFIIQNIMQQEIPKDHVVDHINGQPDDNRLCNLRIANKSANAQNANKTVGDTGFIGVVKNKNVFNALIHVNGKHYHLGTYQTAETAAFAYDCAAKQAHGEDAKTNCAPIPCNFRWNEKEYRLEQIDHVFLQNYVRNRNGYKGVDEVNGKFRANLKIRPNNYTYYLGTFSKAEIAAYAHNCMAIQLYGDKAILNPVEKPEGYEWNSETHKLEIKAPKQNVKKRLDARFRGITKQPNGKWGACIYVGKKRIHLGQYPNEEIAAFAYNCAIIKKIGKEALLNDVQEPVGYKWDEEKMRLVDL